MANLPLATPQTETLLYKNKEICHKNLKSTRTNQTLNKQNKHLIFRTIQYKSKKTPDQLKKYFHL